MSHVISYIISHIMYKILNISVSDPCVFRTFIGFGTEHSASLPDLSKDNIKSYEYRLLFKRKNFQHVTLISVKVKLSL
jgi:hypothetical protein